MKVKCIADRGWELTVGRQYVVLVEEELRYKIKSDDGKLLFYDKNLFEIVEENTNQNITITLTKEEVNTLTALLCVVKGTAKSPRKHVDSAILKVCLGITYHKYTQLAETNLLFIKDGCIFFNDYPEEKSPKQLKIEELQGTIEEMKKQVEQLKKEIL